MPGWLSPWEILILVLVVLLVFGPKRLPEMGRGLGRGMREFKDSITGKEEKRSLAQPDSKQEPEPSTHDTSTVPRDRDSVG